MEYEEGTARLPEIHRGMCMGRKYMKSIAFAAAALVSLSLAGCGASESELPDLSGLGDITVVAREEGSGTRSEFETLVDTAEEGANEVVLSTEQVLELVSDDENAIGYVAFSAIGDMSDVTVLSVDGVACTADTIGDGDYPLGREYILAYSGTLSDLESDFLTYVRSAGQDIAAQICTPVRSATVFLSNGESGLITISGSSSMETLITELIADYQTYNPNAEFEVSISDSTEGLNEAMRGECDFAMSSRSLKSYEEELLEYKAIAADGIAVVVNSENPLTDISTKRLKSIYDGDVTAWSDLQ